MTTNNSCLTSLIAQMSTCQKLNTIRLSDINLSNPRVFNEVLNMVKDLTALQSLDLSDCNLKPEQLIRIANALVETEN